MTDLFDNFPNLSDQKILIKRLQLSDVDALLKISHNPSVYQYIGPFLANKSKAFLKTAIKNLNSRDFDKRKMIIAGIYLQQQPTKLVGLAELFNYQPKRGIVTIGYRLNQQYWHQGIASDTIRLLVDYLQNKIGIKQIKAMVMPANIYSAKALLNNGFVKATQPAQEKNWAGQDIVQVDVYTYEAN